jgi:HAMP domain-containing protein
MSDVIKRIRMDMWAPPIAREAAAEIALLRHKVRRLRDENERLRKALGDLNKPKAWRVEADNA